MMGLPTKHLDEGYLLARDASFKRYSYSKPKQLSTTPTKNVMANVT